jgi:hypothetical protein
MDWEPGLVRFFLVLQALSLPKRLGACGALWFFGAIFCRSVLASCGGRFAFGHDKEREA